jgi:8-oxo-dGTP diphosphatase
MHGEVTIMSQHLSDRPRVSAAVLRADSREVLMVQHCRPDGTTYWQLPGGGIEAAEHPEIATLRELAEETGLVGRIVQRLFVIPYKYGLSTTYLIAVDNYASLHLGDDPEERDAKHQKLIDVAWQPLNAMSDNPEIEALKQALAKLQRFSDDMEQA